MDHLEIFSMFMLGLLGSGHCIGMCGPLIFAFPGRSGRFAPHLFYHLGRTATYVVLGAVMGALGAGVTGTAAALGADPPAGILRLRAAVGLGAAVFLFVFGLARLGIFAEPRWLAVAAPDRIPGFGRMVRAALRRARPVPMTGLGLVMGLLPCGLSFAAFSRALPAGGAWEGAVLVAAFAAGTVPGLLLLGTGASRLIRRYRRQSDILAGLLMFYMGIKLAFGSLSFVRG